MNSSDFMLWLKQTTGCTLCPGVGKLLLFFWVPVPQAESLMGIEEV